MTQMMVEQDIDQQIYEAELEAGELSNQIKEAVERIGKEHTAEDQEILRTLYWCAERYLSLAAWIRAKLDAEKDLEILTGIREMFSEGEDYFTDTLLSDWYEAEKRVEKLYDSKQ